MSGRGQRRAWGALQTALILGAIFVMLAPIAWIALAAFKTHVDVYQLKLFFEPTLENFQLVFDAPYNLGAKLLNSTIVAGVTAIVMGTLYDSSGRSVAYTVSAISMAVFIAIGMGLAASFWTSGRHKAAATAEAVA